MAARNPISERTDSLELPRRRRIEGTRQNMPLDCSLPNLTSLAAQVSIHDPIFERAHLPRVPRHGQKVAWFPNEVALDDRVSHEKRSEVRKRAPDSVAIEQPLPLRRRTRVHLSVPASPQVN